jgi:hypothetical protein
MGAEGQRHMDEVPIVGQVPELEEQTAKVADAELEPAPEPAVEPEPAPEPAAEPEPAPEPASEVASEVEPAPETEEAGGEPEADQLSLDEMVESLKEPQASTDEVAAEAPPEPAEAEEAPATDEPVSGPEGLARDRLAARLPFGIYVGVWVVFAGVMSYLLWPAASGPFTGLPFYAYLVLGGVALTVVGPLLGIVMWLVLRGRADGIARAGLARAIFMRAAAATLAGDLVWWLALVLLDLHRAGVLG